MNPSLPLENPFTQNLSITRLDRINHSALNLCIVAFIILTLLVDNLIFYFVLILKAYLSYKDRKKI